MKRRARTNRIDEKMRRKVHAADCLDRIGDSLDAHLPSLLQGHGRLIVANAAHLLSSIGFNGRVTVAREDGSNVQDLFVLDPDAAYLAMSRSLFRSVFRMADTVQNLIGLPFAHRDEEQNLARWEDDGGSTR